MSGASDSSCESFFGAGQGDSESESSQKETLKSLQKKLKGQAQTAKARAASLLARATRRLAKHAQLVPQQKHEAEEFRQDVQADNDMAKPGHPDRAAIRRRRLRLLVSYLKSWAGAVVEFLSGTTSSPVSPVRSVMNVVQMLILFHGSDDASTRAKVFTVHTPMVCVPKADCDGLFFEMVSRLCFYLGQVSYRFRMLGMAADLLRGIAIQATAICVDALATNQAVLKRLRLATNKAHQQNGFEQIYPVLAILCQIHALALARKCLLTALPGFWSSVVRLGHLFEVSSFRTQFRRALITVIYQSYRYVVVAEMPSGCEDWKQRRADWCRLSLPRKKRHELHKRLMTFDNGDFESRDVVHYCDGSCCEGTSHAGKSRYALIQIMKNYISLSSGVGTLRR